MQLVAMMRRRATLVIDPAMEGVFKQAPTQKTRAITQNQTNRTGAKDERFPKYEERHRQRIGGKAHPVVKAAGRKIDYMTLAGMRKKLSFDLEVSSHLEILLRFDEAL